MRIPLWYSSDLKVWRWCITNNGRFRTEQETGDAKSLDEAMEIIAKTAKKMIGSGEPFAGWFGA